MPQQQQLINIKQFAYDYIHKIPVLVRATTVGDSF